MKGTEGTERTKGTVARTVPAVIQACLDAAQASARRGDWDGLNLQAEVLAREARIRRLTQLEDAMGVARSNVH